jgi:hypothetical protein
MARKHKKKWQIAVIGKLQAMGISYGELADRIGNTYNNVNQVMCKDNMPNIRKQICGYLGLDLERLLKDESEGID